jgi:hypothetical protein
VVASKNSTLHNVKGKRILVEKRPTTKSPVAAEDGETITIDRRENQDRRRAIGRRERNAPVAVERRDIERRVKVSRRRQIDPTTCERDYTLEEIEFMGAMDAYKRHSGRMFPTCSEVLEVLKSLGYEKCSKTEPVVLPALDMPITTSPIPASV